MKNMVMVPNHWNCSMLSRIGLYFQEWLVHKILAKSVVQYLVLQSKAWSSGSKCSHSIVCGTSWYYMISYKGLAPEGLSIILHRLCELAIRSLTDCNQYLVWWFQWNRQINLFLSYFQFSLSFKMAITCREQGHEIVPLIMSCKKVLLFTELLLGLV